MNEKTGKMLSKYARQVGKSAKEIKRWWESLRWTERSRERKRIKKELVKQ